MESLSLGTAVAMLAIYALGLLFAFRYTSPEPELAQEVKPSTHGSWSVRNAVLVLLAATVLIAWLSEILVGAVEYTTEALGISEFFIGIIVVPLVGNVAEHVVAVQAALKNKMELSMAVSVGSSLQIALFVAPVLVFLSLLMGNPLTLVFNQFEIVALFAGSPDRRVRVAGRRIQLAGGRAVAWPLRHPGVGVLLLVPRLSTRLTQVSHCHQSRRSETPCHLHTSTPSRRSPPTSSPSSCRTC